MKSGTYSTSNTENKVLLNVLKHEQSTHSSAPEQSAAHSITLLHKRYNQLQRVTATTEMLLILKNMASVELPDEQKNPFIEYLTELSKSNIQSEFQLVCAAVLDTNNEVFRETAYQANDNRVFRIASLFNAINKLRTEGRCDTGNRNDLLSTLNYIHRDITIIDDYDLFLRSSAKEWLITKWENEANEKELFSRVKEYIHCVNDDIDISLNGSDKSSLIEHWKANLESCGLNWENAEKQALGITNNFYYIDIPLLPSYKSEMSALLVLDALHQSITTGHLPIHLSEYTNQIEKAYELCFECEEFDELNRRGFTLFVHCLKLHGKIYPYVNQMGNHEEVLIKSEAIRTQVLVNKIVTGLAFENNHDLDAINEEIAEQEVRLNQALARLKQNYPFYHFIENVFAIWSSVRNFISTDDVLDLFHEAENSVWTLFETLPNSSWYVSDSEIKSILDSGHALDSSLIIHLTPYQINKFLLHALKTPSYEWSNVFAGALKKLLPFLSNLNENNEHPELSCQLRKSSYPDKLINQLNFLLYLRENKEYRNATLKRLAECNWYIPCVLNDIEIEEFKNVEYTIVNRIGRSNTDDVTEQDIFDYTILLKSYVSELEVNKLHELVEMSTLTNLTEVKYLVHLLPKSRRADFILHSNTAIDDFDSLIIIMVAFTKNERPPIVMSNLRCIKNGEDLSTLLGLLPDSSKREIANRMGECISSSHELALVLSNIDEYDRIQLVEKFAFLIKDMDDLIEILNVLPLADQLKIACYHGYLLNYSTYLKVIKQLNKIDRLAFAKSHADKVRNNNDILAIVHGLPKNDRLSFLNDYINFIEESTSLSYFLNILPEADRFIFAYHYKHIIQDDTSLAQIIIQLPKSSRFTFYVYLRYIQCDPINLRVIFLSFSPSDKKRFAPLFLSTLINGDDLSIALDVFKESNKLFYSQSVLYRDQLSMALNSISPLARYELAKLMLATDTYNQNLDIFISLFPSFQRLKLAIKLCHFPIGSPIVTRVMQILPENDKHIFNDRLTVNSHTNSPLINNPPSIRSVKYTMDIYDEQTVLTVPRSPTIDHSHMELYSETTVIVPPRNKPESINTLEIRFTAQELQFINKTITKLTTYMNRIDHGNPKTLSKRDFEKFTFPFMRTTRGENREINYSIAKVLNTDLHNLIKSQDSCREDLFQLFIKFKQYGSHTLYLNHTVRSSELNAILHLGIDFCVKSKKPIHSMTK